MYRMLLFLYLFCFISCYETNRNVMATILKPIIRVFFVYLHRRTKQVTKNSV